MLNRAFITKTTSGELGFRNRRSTRNDLLLTDFGVRFPGRSYQNGARNKNVDKKLGRERRRVVLKSDLVERNYQELWRNYVETKRPND